MAYLAVRFTRRQENCLGEMAMPGDPNPRSQGVIQVWDAVIGKPFITLRCPKAPGSSLLPSRQSATREIYPPSAPGH